MENENCKLNGMTECFYVSDILHSPFSISHFSLPEINDSFRKRTLSASRGGGTSALSKRRTENLPDQWKMKNEKFQMKNGKSASYTFDLTTTIAVLPRFQSPGASLIAREPDLNQKRN